VEDIDFTASVVGASQRGSARCAAAAELDALEARHHAASTADRLASCDESAFKNPNHCEHSWRSAMLKLLPRLVMH
jgi:hypothetical protein